MNSIFKPKLFSQLNKVAIESLASIVQTGKFITEHTIDSSDKKTLINGKPVINLVSNDFLNLHNNHEVVDQAKIGIKERGFGLGSVRFICGTQDKHKQFETEIAAYYGKEDAISYTSGFAANQGFFEAILSKEDAVFYDTGSHLSIIEGIHFTQASKNAFSSKNYNLLEEQLKKNEEARTKLIATSSVFSNEGRFADVEKLVNLAFKYNCRILLDEAFSTGLVGPTGRGLAEKAGLLDHIDVITTTVGKALGGASGGVTISSSNIVGLLRQKSRTYLFSNNMVPSNVYGSLEALRKIKGNNGRLVKLKINTFKLKESLSRVGVPFDSDEDCPIVILRIKSNNATETISTDLLSKGVYLPQFFGNTFACLRILVNSSWTAEEIRVTTNKIAESYFKHNI